MSPVLEYQQLYLDRQEIFTHSHQESGDTTANEPHEHLVYLVPAPIKRNKDILEHKRGAKGS